jgi:hypothetical protein
MLQLKQVRALVDAFSAGEGTALQRPEPRSVAAEGRRAILDILCLQQGMEKPDVAITSKEPAP